MTVQYQVVECVTKAVVATYATRRAARRSADRRDAAYGAVRYFVRSVEVVQ